MDKFKGVILVAGFGCFIFSVLLSGLYPFLITDAKAEEASIAELASVVLPDFYDLKDQYPVVFVDAYEGADEVYTKRELIDLEASLEMQNLSPAERQTKMAAIKAASDEMWPKVFAQALERGRNIYVADACWHCHSQFVRPAANENIRYGPVNTTEQDNNALQRPMLWGTRRVGPDLTYEGGKRSNDWHVAHLNAPSSVTPGSIMPAYPFYMRSGYQVVRQIDAKKANFGDLDPERKIPVPGIYDSEGAAEAAMKSIQDAHRDANGEFKSGQLGQEASRLSVQQGGLGPNPKGLSLVAYLQWLGTWRPEVTRGDDK